MNADKLFNSSGLESATLSWRLVTLQTILESFSRIVNFYPYRDEIKKILLGGEFPCYIQRMVCLLEAQLKRCHWFVDGSEKDQLSLKRIDYLVELRKEIYTRLELMDITTLNMDFLVRLMSVLTIIPATPLAMAEVEIEYTYANLVLRYRSSDLNPTKVFSDYLRAYRLLPDYAKDPNEFVTYLRRKIYLMLTMPRCELFCKHRVIKSDFKLDNQDLYPLVDFIRSTPQTLEDVIELNQLYDRILTQDKQQAH